MDKEGLQAVLDNLDQLSQEQLRELHDLLGALSKQQRLERAREDLLSFCCYMQDDYLIGKHHRILASLMMDAEKGKVDRICVNMPPRHGKSQLISYYSPAWLLGKHPTHKVLTASHTSDLALDFGRKVRNLIASRRYQEVFPNVTLAADSKSAGRWSTNHGGEYFACGVGSSIAGRGAHWLIIDDPHSEQDVVNGNVFTVFEKAYTWFTGGARPRLMPQGRVIVVQTRWHADDLTGRLVNDMGRIEGADRYKVVEFPALFESRDEATGEIVRRALWPEFFDVEALLRTKASMPAFLWNAEYQQKPTSEEAAIIKREWWQTWTPKDPPLCEYVIISLDTASETSNRADFTALTEWGVFFNETNERHEIILLNSVKERMEFPELKAFALEYYQRVEPDAVIVEKKSSGIPLYQELRRAGIPVSEYTPHRGTGDKMARLNSVSDIVSSGLVWMPQTRWAEEVIEEIAGFPFMSHDDLVDSTVMALMRFRQGGFLRLPSDDWEEPKRRRRHYGSSRYY